MCLDSQKPFIKRFKTPRKSFIYDVNTNRILEVDSPVYDILGDYGHLALDEIRQKYIPQYGAPCVEQALSEIEDARKSEHLFLPDRPQTLAFGLSPEELQRHYATKVSSITLEVTEHCNLRCHYCTWEYLRGAKRKRMSTQTAFTAINFLYSHSSSVEHRFLSFYGGEPLLEFELIKKCVNYARSKFGERDLRFSFTTNGTLIDEEKASYLADNQFNILVSIDGPKRIHDKHRIDKKGRGSYNRAVNGLRTLLKAYGENAGDKVGILMVVTPPYDFDAVNDLWKEQPWLPKNIRIQVNYVSTTWTTFLQDYSCNESQDIRHQSGEENLKSSFMTQILHREQETSPVAISLFEKGMLQIYKRPIWHAPRKTYYLNGCCIPGVRKLFVTCDGTLHMCERAHGAPALGSLSAGYNQSVIRNLINTYAQESIHDCKSCWAVALCTLCFAKAYFNGCFSLELKRKFCQQFRKHLEERLKLYCSILEENPHAFDYMKSMELV